jgi:hypothetical protein
MDKCPYYREETTANGEAIPYCAHKHSPASYLAPSLRTQFPHALRCSGLLSRCQIPPHLQLDIA